MSAAEADRFIADVQADPDRFGSLKAIAEGGDPNQAYAQVQAMGYDASVDELRSAFLEFASSNLSEEQLATVAGGLSNDATNGLIVGGIAAAMLITGGAAAAAAAA